MKELRERTIKGLEPDIARMLERHKDEVARLQAAAEVSLIDACLRHGGTMTCIHHQYMLQEQLAAAAARFEEEKAAAVRQAREHALDNGSEQVAREKDSWRTREAALRQELDREFQTIRVQLTREVDDERRRGLDQLRQENKKHMEEIYKIQQDSQSRINDLTQNFNKEREGHAKIIAEQVELATKVRALTTMQCAVLVNAL
jgi:5-azacytidine-induced protein 1